MTTTLHAVPDPVVAPKPVYADVTIGRVRDHTAIGTARVPAEQHGTIAVTAHVISDKDTGDVRYTGWFTVTHLPTGKRFPATELCLTCARSYAEALAAIDVDWTQISADLDEARRQLAELPGPAREAIKSATTGAEMGCGSYPCQPPDGGW